MHKEPIALDKEIIKGKKKKKKTTKKSNHKHEYVYYKEFVGNGKGMTAFIQKEPRGYYSSHNDWNIYHMCSICGKDSGHIFCFVTSERYEEAITNGVDITPYK